jgi:hypothetical protein
MNENELLLAKAEEIAALQERMAQTLDPLYVDLNFAFDEWRKDTKNQFWRRTLIRCILVVIEASVWNMKNMVLKLSEISGVQLTPKESLLAQELRTTTEDDGQKGLAPKFLPFRDNIKETFKLFAKVHRATYTLNADKGFDALCSTYELRNRLMHPKIPSDIPVSDDDVRQSQLGVKWLNDEYHTLLNACAVAVVQWMSPK